MSRASNDRPVNGTSITRSNMLTFRRIRAIYAGALLLVAYTANANAQELPPSGFTEEELRPLAAEIARKTGQPDSYIMSVLAQATFVPRTIELMDTPGEAVPWASYRARLLTEERIENGRRFMKEHATALALAEARYGVSRQVIAAIIGVETNYGKIKGRYRLLDSLTTLSLRYPRRSTFFRSELTAFFDFSSRSQSDPVLMTGSYAGAFGWGQFMPSSALKLGIDFDGDGRVDLMESAGDTVGSVGHYLKFAGWKRGEQVFHRAEGKTSGNLVLQGGAGVERYTVGANFRAILRYNRSANYAMAVAQLAEAIGDRAVRQ